MFGCASDCDADWRDDVRNQICLGLQRRQLPKISTTLDLLDSPTWQSNAQTVRCRQPGSPSRRSSKYTPKGRSEGHERQTEAVTTQRTTTPSATYHQHRYQLGLQTSRSTKSQSCFLSLSPSPCVGRSSTLVANCGNGELIVRRAGARPAATERQMGNAEADIEDGLDLSPRALLFRSHLFSSLALHPESPSPARVEVRVERGLEVNHSIGGKTKKKITLCGITRQLGNDPTDCRPTPSKGKRSIGQPKRHHDNGVWKREDMEEPLAFWVSSNPPSPPTPPEGMNSRAWGPAPPTACLQHVKLIPEVHIRFDSTGQFGLRMKYDVLNDPLPKSLGREVPFMRVL
ncbi:hypothetical protein BDK51DRAFT_27312 [Blyttiomyces helicus]|uniref:Uncharacterized protein n=1 Tax=Blyttiomyces helicus TaxID=388810 RepID=A0A4P9W300_9FUNG|nr:hypothetical protein BDK51DRAFT_27312 [Blyttiomyces helicus]|eukprot:RKO85198.1 hypothetical protein BDK51DRAFT_27312 [Blyttiomyces helicus]